MTDTDPHIDTSVLKLAIEDVRKLTLTPNSVLVVTLPDSVAHTEDNVERLRRDVKRWLASENLAVSVLVMAGGVEIAVVERELDEAPEDAAFRFRCGCGAIREFGESRADELATGGIVWTCPECGNRQLARDEPGHAMRLEIEREPE